MNNQKKDILPVAGAGQEGTDELVNKYIEDTPGQDKKFLSFREYNDERKQKDTD